MQTDDGKYLYIGIGAQTQTFGNSALTYIVPNEGTAPGKVIVGYNKRSESTTTVNGLTQSVLTFGIPVYATGPFTAPINSDNFSTKISDNAGRLIPNPKDSITVGVTDGKEQKRIGTIRLDTAQGNIAITLYKQPQLKPLQ